MISVSGKKWFERKINKNSIEKIKQDEKFSEIVSKLIISRNFDLNEIYNIKNKSNIINEFKNDKDFLNAINIIENCIKNNETVCIFGDYDVDGTASTSLFVRFFEEINHPYFFYIPDREKDGYGPNKSLFEKLIRKKPKLIIMVDCGSTSNHAVDFLIKNNIKSIIIDHHDINKPYPKSDVIINPKKNNQNSFKDYFCATTLTYFFLKILEKKIKSSFDVSKYLIYVLLALVCDVMPLRKVNRSIALNLINDFDINSNIAFKTLYKLCDKQGKISIDDLAYLIGPIINSGGRLSNSNLAAELLISNNQSIVQNKSLKLINLNNKRKKIENEILNEINFKKISKENKDVIIYYNANLNEGIIGIIASRLKDYFNKPSIVITNSKNSLKGSARSTINYNIGTVIKKLLDKGLIDKGGGHNMAAGFSMKKNSYVKVENFILEDCLKNSKNSVDLNKYDSEISASAINQRFFNEINQIGPFGYGNPIPTFLIKDLKIIKVKILKERHLNIIFKTLTGSSINSKCFNSLNSEIGNYLMSYKKKIHVIAEIKENIWNNKKSLQLNIKDLFVNVNLS